MRDYQVQGLNWMVSLHHNGINGILADEMVRFVSKKFILRTDEYNRVSAKLCKLSLSSDISNFTKVSPDLTSSLFLNLHSTTGPGKLPSGSQDSTLLCSKAPRKNEANSSRGVSSRKILTFSSRHTKCVFEKSLLSSDLAGNILSLTKLIVSKMSTPFFRRLLGHSSVAEGY